ncbi:MAG: hypothetical protein AB9M60_21160 [Leptothrix sp. (in: b-proteobacteria)]
MVFAVFRLRHLVATLRGIMAFAVIGASVTSSHAAENCGPAFDNKQSGGKNFSIYHSLVYRGQPDLEGAGIRKVRIIDRDVLTENKADPQIDARRVQALVPSIPQNQTPLILDFEQFSTSGDPQAVNRSIGKLNEIAAAFRAAQPGLKIGHYGVLPVRDYWRSLSQDRRNGPFRDWQIQNDRLKQLEQHVDVLFPSLYTFYEDQEGWRKFAVSQICEARRISDKPVIVFLWPEYHDSNQKVQGRFIPGDYWKMQLETAYRYADGIVIWGGYDIKNRRPHDWDEQAAWWQQTVAFMKKMRQQ